MSKPGEAGFCVLEYHCKAVECHVVGAAFLKAACIGSHRSPTLDRSI